MKKIKLKIFFTISILIAFFFFCFSLPTTKVEAATQEITLRMKDKWDMTYYYHQTSNPNPNDYVNSDSELNVSTQLIGNSLITIKNTGYVSLNMSMSAGYSEFLTSWSSGITNYYTHSFVNFSGKIEFYKASNNSLIATKTGLNWSEKFQLNSFDYSTDYYLIVYGQLIVRTRATDYEDDEDKETNTYIENASWDVKYKSDTFSFKDDTEPTISITGSNTNGIYTNSIKVLFNEPDSKLTECYYTINNGSKNNINISNTTNFTYLLNINTSGTYCFYATNSSGLTASKTINTDCDKPSLSLYIGDKILSDGQKINKALSIKTSDNCGVASVIVKDSKNNIVHTFDSNSYNNTSYYSYNGTSYNSYSLAKNQLISDVKASATNKIYNNNIDEIWIDSSNKGFINGTSYYYYNNMFFLNETILEKYIDKELVNKLITKNTDTFTPSYDDEYTVIAKDVNGLETRRSFFWDATAPTLPFEISTYKDKQLTVNMPNDCTKWEVFTNSGAKEYTTSQTLSYDNLFGANTYYFIFYDSLNNSSTTSFIWDCDKPIITATNLDSNNMTNKSSKITASDSYLSSLTINGVDFTSGDTYTPSADGSYLIVATDICGNQETLLYTYDKTNPTITIDGLTNNKTNHSVSISASDLNGIASLIVDGTEFTSGNTFNPTVSKTIKVVATDTVGNITTYSFEVDLISPSITKSWSGSRTNAESIYITFNSDEATATFEGSSYTSGNKIYASNYSNLDGKKEYVFYITDSFGNKSNKISFYWDRTPSIPTVSLSDGTFENNMITNAQSITFNLKSDYYTYELRNEDGQIIDSGTNTNNSSLSKIYNFNNYNSSQTYYFTTYDAYGNKYEFNWYWDCIKPDGTFTYSGDIINNSSIIKFNWTDPKIASCILTLPYNIYYDTQNSDVLYLNRTVLENKLLEELKVNITTQTYEHSMSNYVYYNEIISPGDTCYVYDGYIFATEDSAKTYIIEKKIGTRIISYKTINISKDQNLNFSDFLSVSGTYKIVLTDTANNSSPYEWYWDCNPLIIEAKTEADNIINKNDISFTNVKLNIIKDTADEIISSKKITLNGSVIDWTNTLTLEGDYFIEVIDNYYNISTFAFSIVKHLDYSIYNNTAEIDKLIAYNQDINIKWNNNLYTATLNGEAYTKGTLISEEGQYSFIISLNSNGDVLNNEFIFYIDKTADYNNYNSFVKSGYNWESIWYNTDKNSKIYSFRNYSDAYLFAKSRELELTYITEFDGNIGGGYLWQGQTVNAIYDNNPNKLQDAINNNKIYIYKNKVDAYVIFYDYNDYQECLEYNITKSISIHYNINADNRGEVYNEADFYKNAFYINASSISLNKVENGTSIYYSTDAINYTLLFTKDLSGNILDGNPTKLSMINNKPTKYYIQEIDKAGNVLTYTIILDTEKTSIQVLNGKASVSGAINNGVLGSTTTLYTTTGFTFTPANKYDNEYFIIEIKYYKVDGTYITSYIIGDDFSISDKIDANGNALYDEYGFYNGNYVGFGTGTYEFLIYSASGVKSNKYTIYYQYKEPTISWETLTAEDGTETGLNLKITYEKIYNISNPLTNLVITRGINDEYVLVNNDDSASSIVINITNLSYYFNTNGDYLLSITDIFGNNTESSATLTLNAPRGYLYINNKIATGNNNYGQRAYLTWNIDYGYTATLHTIIGQDVDGNYITVESPYSRENAIITDGSYFIALSNGNETKKYFFIIDTIAPSAKIYADNVAMSSGATTGSKQCYLSWDEEGLTCYLNSLSNPYTMGDYLTLEGENIWYLYDRAGNCQKIYAYIDWTPIDVVIKTSSGTILENGSIINKKIQFTWSGKEKDATVYFTASNGTIITYPKYVSGTSFSDEGTYHIYITDPYNNTSDFAITIDYTIPSASLVYGDNEDQIINGSNYYINMPFSTIWYDEEYYLIINKKYYNKGDIIETEGEYNVIVESKSKNQLTFTVNISYVIPEATLTNVENGGYTNKNVYAIFNSSITATLNDSPYLSNTKISDEGYYELILTNKYGSTNTYTFIIDKTPEILYLSDNIYSGGYTNGIVYAYWNDPTNVLGTITKYYGEGIYYDIKNPSIKTNYSEIETSIINEILPLATTESYNSANAAKKWNDASNVSFINGKECYVYNDLYFASLDVLKKYIKTVIAPNRIKDANEPINYLSGSYITEEGEYIISIVDLANNMTTVSFVIDKQPCEFNNNRNISSGDTINKSIYFYWAENSAVGYLNGEIYKPGTLIKEDGIYLFKTIDVAGNESKEFVFTIKTTLPSGNLLNVENGSYTNKIVYFSWLEENCHAYLSNGSTEMEYISGTPIAEAANWTIRLVDLAGNEATYSFEISYEIPTAELINVENGGYTSKNVYITFPSDCTATLNGIPYASNKKISDENTYEFVIKNKYGSTNTYTFIIERVEPVAILSCDKYTNQPVYLLWSDSTYTVNVSYNDKINIPYESGTKLSEEATYIFTVCTRAGVSKTYTAELSYQEPVGIFKNLNDNNFSNKPVYFIFTETGSTATLDGNPYLSNTKIATEGKHQIILNSKYGNIKKFDFELDLTPPSATLFGIKNPNGNFTNESVYIEWFEEGATATISYSNISRTYTSGEIISDANNYLIILTDIAGNEATYSFEISYEIPELSITNVNENGYSNKNISLYTVSNGDSIFVNNAKVDSGYTIRTDGEYTIVVRNKFFTEKSYTIIRDTIPCEIEIYNIYTSNSNGNFTSQPVKLYWHEESANAYLYKNGELVGEFNYDNEVIEEGSYTLYLYDIAGNESSVNFEISYQDPVGTFTNINENGYTNKSTAFVWDDESIATLDGNPYINGKSFSKEGSHEILLTSIYGTSKYFYITQDFTLPTATLSGVKEGGYTNKPVKVLFSEGTATLNGLNYESGTEITEAKKYDFILKDLADNTYAISFTISFEIPKGTLNGVEDGGITNQPVSLTWDDTTYYCYLDGIKYTSGKIIKTDGEHEFKLYNKFGSFVVYNCIIDTVKASLEIELADGTKADITKALNDNLYINQSFKLIPSEDNTTIKFNNIIYSLDQFLDLETKYTISITDIAGNVEYYYVNLLLSEPEYELINVENGGYTNTYVKINYNANLYHALVNGKEYESGTKLSEDNVYYVSIYDKAGNESTIQFEISTKESVGTLVGVEDEGYTNGIVQFIFNEEGSYATITRTYTDLINDVSQIITTPADIYISGTEITQEGEYFITLTNKFNVKSVVSFNIDLTPASVEELIIKNVKANGYTNKSVSITWDNPLYSITINDEEYKSGRTITKNGLYNVSVIDLANNILNFTFEINDTFDKESIEIKAYKVEDKNNKIPNDKEVSFEWNNETYDVKLYKNEKIVDYQSGEVITEIGQYKFLAVDKFGNEYIQEFEILDTTVDHTTQNIITIVIIGTIASILIIGIIIRLTTKRKGIYIIK